MALGASRSKILSMIMREAATLLFIGLVIGAVLALAAGTTARALLFGLQPGDPITLVMASASLAVIALAASFLPAQRAAALDPMQALRDE
jgi:ABC-type antimicrobial peptide transport system permease subunit